MRRFGIEIEAIGMGCSEVASLLRRNGIDCVASGYNHHVLSTWKVVTDSSINGNQGFEVVSPPLAGEEGIEQVRKVIEVLNESGCDVNRSCGIHVHVEVNDLPSAHLANIFNRYREFEGEIDRFMPRSRRSSNNTYCKSLTQCRPLQVKSTNAETCRAMTDRYHKINLTSYVKYGTIEFRQHSGSLNRAKVANWVRFLIQFVEQSQPEVARQIVEVTPANPVASGLTRTQRSIVDFLQDGAQHHPADIATSLNLRVNTVRTNISRLRKKGYHISTGCLYRLLAGATSTGIVREVVSGDSLWKGITVTIKSYYTRRVSTIAA